MLAEAAILLGLAILVTQIIDWIIKMMKEFWNVFVKRKESSSTAAPVTYTDNSVHNTNNYNIPKDLNVEAAEALGRGIGLAFQRQISRPKRKRRRNNARHR